MPRRGPPVWGCQASKAKNQKKWARWFLVHGPAKLLGPGLHWHARRIAQGQTGLAAVAVGAVGEHAAAAKALIDQFGIHLIVDQVTGRGHLRACLALRQIAAFVRRRCIKLQGLQGQVVQVRQGAVSKAVSAGQYRDCSAQSMSRC